MNILMITHDFPPLGGGISRHVFELSKTLSAEHSIIVLNFIHIEKESKKIYLSNKGMKELNKNLKV